MQIMQHTDRLLYQQVNAALKDSIKRVNNLEAQLAEAYDIIESLLSRLSDSPYKREMSDRKKDLENS